MDKGTRRGLPQYKEDNTTVTTVLVMKCDDFRGICGTHCVLLLIASLRDARCCEKLMVGGYGCFWVSVLLSLSEILVIIQIETRDNLWLFRWGLYYFSCWIFEKTSGEGGKNGNVGMTPSQKGYCWHHFVASKCASIKVRITPLLGESKVLTPCYGT